VTLADRVYFLVTVDGDLRIGTPEQQIAGILAMRGVHHDLGLYGCTSWMINELDFRWTEVNPHLLLDLVDTGECVGIHDHFDTYFADTYQVASPLAARSKKTLEAFFQANARTVTLNAHRNGCAIQGEAIYRALKDCEYSILSDVRPGVKWFARMLRDGTLPSPWRCLGPDDSQAILMDNSALPLTAVPWRHDVDNWLDTHSDQGPFVQVPINSMPLLDRGRVAEAITGTVSAAFICLDTHPYDLQDPATGEISPERVADFRRSLEWVRETYNPKFIRLDQVPESWESFEERGVHEDRDRR
jgi:hypothetical protein